LQIQIKCKGAAEVPLKKLLAYQGNLKSLDQTNYEKLKNEIADQGFAAPVQVWKDGKDHWIIDGHQRVRTLGMMIENGFELKDNVPITYCYPDDEDQARRMLLSMASTYGKVEGQGLYEYVIEHGISVDELSTRFSFSDLNMPYFLDEYFRERESSANDGAGESEKSFNIVYNMVFDDIEQQEKFFEFVSWLKKRYPEHPSIGSRMKEYFEEVL